MIAFLDGQLIALNHGRPEGIEGLEESFGPIGRILRSKATGEDLRAVVQNRGPRFAVLCEDVESGLIVAEEIYSAESAAVLRGASFVLGVGVAV